MKLTDENIAEVMEKVEEFFASAHSSQTDKLKLSLILEDSLIKCQENFGEDHEFKVITRKWFGTPRILLKIKGKPFLSVRHVRNAADF